MKMKKQNRGSAILPTLLIILILVGAGFTYLDIALTEFRMAYRTQDLQGALNLAEGGVEEAMLAMKKDDWTGWKTVTTDQYHKTITDLPMQNGRMGNITVYASIIDESAPIIFSEGKITSSYGSIAKQLRMDLEKKGLFANGLTAKKAVVFNGNKIAIDSYDSNNGNYDPTSNRNDNGTVGSLAVTVGAVTSGNADIWGYVATGGGTPAIGPSGSVLGEDSPGGSSVDWDRVAMDFYADFPNMSAPSVSSPLTVLPSSGTIGTSSASSPTYYKIPSYSNQSADSLVIDGPVVIIIDGDLTIKGEIQVTSNGNVEMYVGGDVDIGGNGMVNTTTVPENLVLFGTSSTPGQQIKISGNGALEAAIYAPNADLELKGSGTGGVFSGAAVADNITMTGNFEFHYDEALDDYTKDNSYKVSLWRELIESDERVPLDTPSSMVKYAVSYDKELVSILEN
jgi:hypothetical protein